MVEEEGKIREKGAECQRQTIANYVQKFGVGKIL